MTRKILIKLHIVQTSIKEGYEAHRFNPYNPLSYVALILILVIGIVMFGFVGIWNETDTRNPFKWEY